MWRKIVNKTLLLLFTLLLLVGCGKKSEPSSLEPDHYPRTYPGGQ